MRLRIDLAYDGTAYAGWARQPGQSTVQEELEQALDRVLRTHVTLNVAGRTDAGVHARAQVAHFDVLASVWGSWSVEGVGNPTLLRRLAGALPRDIRVRSVTLAPPGFDARFSALWRRYAYRIRDEQRTVDPLERGWVLWHPRHIDLDRINAASALLLGEHDFAAFCRRREGATTIRTLLGLTWRRDETGMVIATVRADAFCHSMVRALVGALLPAGENRRNIEWPGEVLASRVRHSAVTVAPAHGLVLEEIRYPPASEMAARAVAARHLRSL